MGYRGIRNRVLTRSGCAITFSAKKLVPGEPNVAYICSRFYRAPELIFGATDYTTAVGASSLCLPPRAACVCVCLRRVLTWVTGVGCQTFGVLDACVRSSY